MLMFFKKLKESCFLNPKLLILLNFINYMLVRFLDFGLSFEIANFYFWIFILFQIMGKVCCMIYEYLRKPLVIELTTCNMLLESKTLTVVCFFLLLLCLTERILNS